MPDEVEEQVVGSVPPVHRPDASARDAGGRVRRSRLRFIANNPVLVLTAGYFAIAWAFIPELASRENLSNVGMNMLPLLAVAVGQTIVLITGGIDLSVTSIIALTSVAGAWAMTRIGNVPADGSVAVLVGAASMLAIGAGIGLLNGAAITLVGLPPFIVTLTTMMSVSGLAIWSTNSESIGNLPGAFTVIGSGGRWGVPYALLIVAGLAVLAHLLLSRTLLGQRIYAVGHSPRVSAVSGIPVWRVTTTAYVLSGVCAAVASIIYTARLETGSPTLGREILLDVVGAVVIGGTSLFGGRGDIVWTVFGVALFSLVANTLNLLGLEHFTIMMVKGGVILLAASLDVLRVRIGAGK